MVTQVVTRLVDDLEGGEAAETVFFAVGGTAYEIDLNANNARSLREAFAPFTEHARRISLARRRRRGPTDREKSADIRAWARARGKSVSDRGRIPVEVVREYEQAH